MTTAVFIFESDKTFDYRSFAKHLIDCSNVFWREMPGVDCHLEQFIASVSIELNIDKKGSAKIVFDMSDLGFITMHGRRDDPEEFTVAIARKILFP